MNKRSFQYYFLAKAIFFFLVILSLSLSYTDRYSYASGNSGILTGTIELKPESQGGSVSDEAYRSYCISMKRWAKNTPKGIALQKNYQRISDKCDAYYSNKKSGPLPNNVDVSEQIQSDMCRSHKGDFCKQGYLNKLRKTHRDMCEDIKEGLKTGSNYAQMMKGALEGICASGYKNGRSNYGSNQNSHQPEVPLSQSQDQRLRQQSNNSPYESGQTTGGVRYGPDTYANNDYQRKNKLQDCSLSGGVHKGDCADVYAKLDAEQDSNPYSDEVAPDPYADTPVEQTNLTLREQTEKTKEAIEKYLSREKEQDKLRAQKLSPPKPAPKPKETEKKPEPEYEYELPSEEEKRLKAKENYIDEIEKYPEDTAVQKVVKDILLASAKCINNETFDVLSEEKKNRKQINLGNTRNVTQKAYNKTLERLQDKIESEIKSKINSDLDDILDEDSKSKREFLEKSLDYASNDSTPDTSLLDSFPPFKWVTDIFDESNNKIMLYSDGAIIAGDLLTKAGLENKGNATIEAGNFFKQTTRFGGSNVKCMFNNWWNNDISDNGLGGV